MVKVFIAIFAALLAQMMIIGVETVAGIDIELMPRLLIAVPLTLIIEFPMMLLYEEVRK